MEVNAVGGRGSRQWLWIDRHGVEFGGEVVANLLTGVDDNAQLENVFEGPDLVIDLDIGADFTVQLGKPQPRQINCGHGRPPM